MGKRYQFIFKKDRIMFEPNSSTERDGKFEFNIGACERALVTEFIYFGELFKFKNQCYYESMQGTSQGTSQESSHDNTCTCENCSHKVGNLPVLLRGIAEKCVRADDTEVLNLSVKPDKSPKSVIISTKVTPKTDVDLNYKTQSQCESDKNPNKLESSTSSHSFASSLQVNESILTIERPIFRDTTYDIRARYQDSSLHTSTQASSLQSYTSDLQSEPLNLRSQSSSLQIQATSESAVSTLKTETSTFLSSSINLPSTSILQSQPSTSSGLTTSSSPRRSFVCGHCFKTFYHKGDYNKHQRTHSGEKPFACAICDRRFPNSSNLNRHLRVHSGEKPFECDICAKRFARRDKLEQHRHTKRCSSQSDEN